MSRLVGQLEKAYRILNTELFDGMLPEVIITVQSSSKSYAHYTPWDAWSTEQGGKAEINIASGSLDRPLENVLASLVHEMIHCYNDRVLNIQDCSNGGMYHNKYFRRAAEAHGLNVCRSEKYGWSHTEPGDKLLDVILEHYDELKEIKICRNDPYPSAVSIGVKAGSNSGTMAAAKPSHHRKYICPVCGCSVRATKAVHIGCLNCGRPMIEV